MEKGNSKNGKQDTIFEKQDKTEAKWCK